MRILFKNAKILKLDNKDGFLNGHVVVDDNIIAYVGEQLPKGKFNKVIDVGGNILMPGFINTHCHSPMVLLRGIKDDATLEDWLFNNVIKIEKKLTQEDVYFGQLLAVMEYVRGGTTTIEEGYLHQEASIKALAETGMRARVDVGSLSAGGEFDTIKNKKLLNLVNASSNLSPACFVHSTYTASKQLILDYIKFCKDNAVPISIHLSETATEVKDCKKKYKKKTPTEFLQSIGFFKVSCALCYHCVHVTQKDLKILKAEKASVSTCAASNLKLASGIAPVYKMLQEGINVTIGTDGAASNNSLDMFKEMYLVATLAKTCENNAQVVSAKEVLKMATLNGAKALGINAGEIKEGKLADIILIDINQPHYQPLDNLLSHLVYSGKSSDVYLTMVGGKVLYENGKYNLGIKEQQVYKKVNEIRERVKI